MGGLDKAERGGVSADFGARMAALKASTAKMKALDSGTKRSEGSRCYEEGTNKSSPSNNTSSTWAPVVTFGGLPRGLIKTVPASVSNVGGAVQVEDPQRESAWFTNPWRQTFS
jgi:hypothetical protein